MGLQPGHSHTKTLAAPLGFIFVSIVDLGDGPVQCFGRDFYKANGNNGTTDLRGKFIRMNDGNATGGADSITLTRDQMPNHTHDLTCTWRVGSSGLVSNTNNINDNNLVTGGITGYAGQDPVDNRPAFQELYPYQAVG